MTGNFITPDWPAPSSVFAYSTTREGGVSAGPYASFNLGMKSGDDVESVLKNHTLLKEGLNLPSMPAWLNQIHENHVIDAAAATHTIADAAFAKTPNVICAVQTADCLPILICDEKGQQVAAIHAGWRGLASGIIKNTLETFKSLDTPLLAWLGPAISAKHFIVQADVYTRFVDASSEARQAFHPVDETHWACDLYMLARQQLWTEGVKNIYGGTHCTYSEENHFFSYRRDKGQTGRMASLIWLNS